MSALPGLLAWIAPPVVGAAIGWITNDIAIRMLFRPLAPVRVLGLRLPLTPGVIPRERRNLAVSIGRMVSRELITEEAVRRQVHEPRTLAALAASVTSATAELLARPLGALAARRADEPGGPSLLPAALEEVLASAFARAAASPAVEEIVRDLARRAAAALGRRRLSEAAVKVDLEGLLAAGVLPSLARGGATAGRAAGDLVAAHAAALLTDGALEAAVRLAGPLVPAAVERLVAWVDGPETRAAIGREARRIIAAAVEQLNGVQRLIVGVAQFERRLDERMPAVVDEVVASLARLAQSPANQARFVAALAAGLRDWRDGIAADPAKAAALGDAVATTVARLAEGLADPERRRRLAADVAGRVAAGRATFGDLLRGLSGLEAEAAADLVADRALAWLSRDGGRLATPVASFAHRFVATHADTPLGDLLGIDAGRKERLDAFLSGQLVRLVDAKLPEMLSGLDVETLVSARIDALDVRDVERLLLQVLAPHLKWINVFGAILGAFIGLVQSVLNLVLP